jgi:ubiquinone/menaquinone biosynthesis C-methylase UbiE
MYFNPHDTDTYLSEFIRVLVPGGIAVIHNDANFVR